jgi:hypothetical protein
MNEMQKPMRKRRGPGSKGFVDREPEITSSGIGKDYLGFRMFHFKNGTAIEYIGKEYELRAPSQAEAQGFKRDLAIAAKNKPEIAQYIGQHPELKYDEPLEEGPMTQPPETASR